MQKRTIHVLIALYAITAMISLATAWAEIGHLDKPKSMISMVGNTASQAKKPAATIKAPTPVIDELPEFILQHETRGRQVIPGSKYPSAESIYENLDPNTMLQLSLIHISEPTRPY
jgi:flagellar basal body-associated protein FliL